MSSSLTASNPDLNATVNASAGTGKTWLLVTRLIRLLLAGARADGILAVTFTRKAATEMQTRLNARLLELAQSEPAKLKQLLQQIDAPTDAATLKRATTLYEDLLRSPFTVKTTTFHAFCQDILRRFPLEAGIPPGFELLESTAELQRAAWDALCAEAGRQPQSPSAQAIETLFENCNGLANTQTVLNSFLDHRSDWWAFTEAQPDPLNFAVETLGAQLKVSETDTPEADFFSTNNLELLTEFVSLLQKHAGKKNAAALDALAIARDENEETELRFTQCIKAFFTATGTPLARKESKAQAKSMGDDGQQRFLELHFQICEKIQSAINVRKAMNALCRNKAWYQAGEALLAHYQQLKAEQRLLDFADLEWQAYQLLNHSDNVHWIQYKLDQRIDHLLIDEFQDTNPTQWRLILPILEELAANEDKQQRSVFLVGDNKQSIYRFRRADPELFVTAQDWLDKRLDAVSQPLDTSWRSAEAIMTLVNRAFGEGVLHQQLMDFSTHTTHLPQLWGHVEFLPLIENEDSATEHVDDTFNGLRNPLETPRVLEMDQRHLTEGRLIAERIRSLIDNNTLIGPADDARPAQYGDIIILLRHRTHAGDYEQALREADIPYIGANRGTLLQSLEVQDLVRLLSLLVTPFNNLALASVLRSPLFNCSDNDLITLAELKEGDWMQRLTTIGALAEDHSNLQRAHTLLSRWRENVGTMPVHDLLDRIYCEGDVLNRYHAAYPSHLQHRVAANLTRFIELALEIDSGRYPSIGRFVSRLQTLQQQEQDAPDEGSPLQAGSRVRLMTIHAAKGLEAPIVFLVDATNTRTKTTAHQAVIDWPAQAPRPESFLLASSKEQQDSFTQHILERHEQAETREDANLLYVAITRPKQYLFISGCRPLRGKALGWYDLLQAPFNTDDNGDDEESPTAGLVFNSGVQATQPADADVRKESGDKPRLLFEQLSANKSTRNITPSRLAGEPIAAAMSNETDADGRTRGIAIHRMLQLLCEQATDIRQRVATELGLPHEDKNLKSWLDCATKVFQSTSFSHLFDPTHFVTAHNEVPLHYNSNGQNIYGIIDRLVINDDGIWLVDYKTHQTTSSAELDALADHYRPQLEYYQVGIQRLWPELPIKSGLLFTHTLTWKPLVT